MQKTRVAVVGAGAFGRNHLRVYREMEAAGAPVELIAMVDRDEAVLADAAARYGIAGFASVEAMLAVTAIDAASVSVPTVHHAAAASELIAGGCDVLVEKPLAASLEEADALIRLAELHGRVLQVGHLERFNPAVAACARKARSADVL